MGREKIMPREIIFILILCFSFLSCSVKQEKQKKHSLDMVTLLNSENHLPGAKFDDSEFDAEIESKIKEITNEISNNKNNMDLYVERGFYHCFSANSKDAKKDFIYVLSYDSLNIKALCGMAFTFPNEEEKAIIKRRLLSINKHNFISYLTFAILEENEKKCIEYSDSSISLNPNLCRPYVLKAIMMNHSEQPLDSVLEVLDAGIARKIDTASTYKLYLFRQMTNEHFENWSNVLDDYDSMAVLDKKNSAVYLELKIDYLKKLGDSLAIREIKETLKKMAKSTE